ncbi:MAG: wax ester/triacylglycerol synthase family O-acyltransferase [Acidimicrobiia bacterium]|nr:wax ester/triacylglycerol synthase family O-acyltransferase [Acidimicrobiia bacterium]
MPRVSGPDAAFLYGETPSWHMHVSALLVVDPKDAPGGFDTELFKRIIERRLHRAPQFRWKLQHVPLGLERPSLVDDAAFDIDHHVHRIGCPSPGGPAELGELVGTLSSLKIDRTRPLWEIWVIEGLQGGEVAILAKIHHSIIDGVAAAEVAMLLFDPTPDPVLDEAVTSGEADTEVSVRDLVGDAVRAVVSTPARLTRLARSLARQGSALLGYLGRPDPPSLPFSAPMSLTNGRLTPERRFDATDISLADAKAVKDAYGVTLNDVILAVCAGALRHWLISHGALPGDPLVAQVPVSTRTTHDRQGDGTRVSNMSVPLATEIDDPAERLYAIHAGARYAKEVRSALSETKTVHITEAVSPALVNLAARAYRAGQIENRGAPFNLIVSNIPGPPTPLFVAGAELLSVFPMGPLLMGGGLNITVMSYCDSIDFGLLSCPDVVPDAWTISDAIPFALKELADAAPLHAASR